MTRTDDPGDEADLMVQVFPPFEPEQEEEKKRRTGFGPRRKIPVRILIPNILTLVGLIAGLTAIRMGIEGRYEFALIAIVLAALFDALDGRIARLLKASSRFGAELDSLADFVNFGVAPAIVIFTWALEDHKSVGWIAVLMFALCAALRLARFNVSMDAGPKASWKANFFTGVPAPAGALLVLLPLYLNGLGVPHVTYFAPLIILYTVVIAILMVSRLPTYSGKLVGQKIKREYVLPLFVLAVMFFAVLATYPYTTLTLSALTYLAFLPVSFVRYKKLEETMAQDEPREEDTSDKASDSEDNDPQFHGPPQTQKKSAISLHDRLQSANDV